MIIERPLHGRIHVRRITSPRVELLGEATEVRIHRGGTRRGSGVKTDVGIMTIRLLNSEDPLDGGTVTPGQEIQATRRRASGTIVYDDPLFTGRVVDVRAAYPLDKYTGEERTYVDITVADAVRVHGSTPRYGAFIGEPFYETFEARIVRLAGSALGPILPPEEGDPVEVYAL